MNDFDSLSSQIKKFSRDLEAIRDYVSSVEPVLTKLRANQFKKDKHYLLPAAYAILDKKIPQKIQKEISRHSDLEIIEENGKQKIVTKSRETAKEVDKAFETMMLHMGKTRFLYETSMVNLISATETFFAKILKTYYKRFPDLVTEKSEKSFTYRDLEEFKTIDDAKQFLLEKKIDSIIRSNSINWIEYLKNQLKIDTTRVSNFMDDFHEYFLRRNLLVHNDGFINKLYMKNLPESHKTKKLNPDTAITVEPEYLIRATYLMEIIWLDISTQIAEKNLKDNENLEKFYDSLSNISYKHLLEERYIVSEYISLFLSENSKLNEEQILIAKINYWLSVKYQGRFSEIKTDIEEIDISAKDKKYELAKMALLEKNKEFFELLPQVLEPKGDTSISMAQEWPLFKVQRRNKRKWGETIKKISTTQP